jgi:hypothetical protein
LCLPAVVLGAALLGVHGLFAQHLRGQDGLEPELVVIDLNGDGIRLTTVAEGVRFPFVRDGMPEATAWTMRGSDDAFLGIDMDRNGRLASAHELLGGILGPPNGLEYLTLLDGRNFGAARGAARIPADGVCDERDDVFGRLIVWTDSNHDGQSAEEELQSLVYAGFASIDLAGIVRMNRTDTGGNVTTARTVARRKSGSSSPNVELITVRLAGTASPSR